MDFLHRFSEAVSDGRVKHTRLADGTGVLVDTESLQVLATNESGAFVVERVGAGVDDEQRLVDEIVAEFDVDRETASGDLERFLQRIEASLFPAMER